MGCRAREDQVLQLLVGAAWEQESSRLRAGEANGSGSVLPVAAMGDGWCAEASVVCSGVRGERGPRR